MSKMNKTDIAYNKLQVELGCLMLLALAEKREGQGVPVKQVTDKLGREYWIDKYGFRARFYLLFLKDKTMRK